MDGRDIGTIVFPQAELKLFVTADPLIRANRRLIELQAVDPTVTLAIVSENLQHRDLIDSTREHSPLRQAHDALILDNSHITKQEQFEIALKWAMERIG
jgi:cytidylate kinase